MAKEKKEAKEKEQAQEEHSSPKLTKGRKKELRSLLIGDLRLGDDGKLVSGGNRLFTPWGAGEGALSVAVFGIKRKNFYYSSALKNNKQVMFQTVKAMQNIGRAIYMQSAPEGKAVYIRRFMVRPTVLLLEENDDSGFTLNAYCGRSPLAFVAIKKSVKLFENEMKGKIKRIEE